MPYVLIGCIIGAFSLGFGWAWHLQSGRVEAMEMRMQQADAEAVRVLEKAQSDVMEAEIKAVESNLQWDKANEQSIQTINAWHDKHSHAVGMLNRDKGCAATVPKSHPAGIGEKNGADLLPDDAAILSDRREASRCAVEKNALLTWATANCGIKP